MTISMATFGIMTLRKMGLILILSLNDRHYNVILGFIVNVMLSVVMLNVVMLSVTAPLSMVLFKTV